VAVKCNSLETGIIEKTQQESFDVCYLGGYVRITFGSQNYRHLLD
jgi:hypothetical protein